MKLHTALVTNHHVTVTKVMPTYKVKPAWKDVQCQDRQKAEHIFYIILFFAKSLLPGNLCRFCYLCDAESCRNMAPQTSIPVAANVLGTVGTVFWCIQLVPQIWYNWKQKKTDGLPGLMMFLWATGTFPNNS